MFKLIKLLCVCNWILNKLFDLIGKKYVIIGGNSGIGYEVVRIFGEVGVDVIFVCWFFEKVESVWG